MQQSIGAIIRHARRQRHLTQKELAGGRFSKAYVSAVEHNRITPSPEALRFLAERLGQRNGDFAVLREHVQASEPLSVLQVPPASPESNGPTRRDGAFALLNTPLEQTEFARSLPSHEPPVLAPDELAALSRPMQARYSFLMGLHAKEKRDLPLALRAFEAALALAPAGEQAIILDEIGRIHFLMHAYCPALGYHLHALQLLSKASSNATSAFLRFQVELHCGEAYRQLGAYQHALEHYEQARMHLKAQHDLATAGQLYWGLGYCTYGALYPATVLSVSSAMHLHVKAEQPEQIEREFQKAISFLLQSRNFYQVAGEHLKEANVRLLLASLLLDMSTWRRRLAQERARKTEKQESLTNCLALLNEAAEHCRQVLLSWQEPDERNEIPPELDSILYVALAALIRIAHERVNVVRLEGSSLDGAYRERAFAAYLCQQVLETLSIPSLPWATIRQAVNMSAETLTYQAPSLPRLTELASEFSETSPHRLLRQVEMYFAAGEVAEELGRTTPLPSYAQDCYVQANQYFQAALSLAYADLVQEERDPGYLARLYLRCAALLEERAFASPAFYEQTTKAFLGVLFSGFAYLQSNFLDKKTWPAQGNDERTSE